MTTVRTSALLILLAVTGVSPAIAQSALRSQGSSDGPPERTRRMSQQFNGSLQLLGGYDDNVTPPRRGIAVPSAKSPGYIGFVNTSLNYGVAKSGHSLGTAGNVFMNSYRNLGRSPTFGGDAVLRASSALGSRTTVEASQAVRNDPFMLTGAFAGLSIDRTRFSPDTNPAYGLVEQRSTTTSTAASVRRQWTRQSASKIEYQQSRHRYENSSALDTQMHAASLLYDHTSARSVVFNGRYRYSDINRVDPGGLFVSLVSHVAEIGLNYQLRLSRRKALSFSGTGAVTFFRTLDASGRRVPHRFPSLHGGTSIDLGGNWTASANYRRALSGLNGALGEAFSADSSVVGVTGPLTSRIMASISAGSSIGKGVQGTGGVPPSRFSTYVGTADMQILITPWWAATVNYTRHYYNLNQETVSAIRDLVPGLAPKLDRNMIRIGLTLNLPTAGITRTRMRPRRN